MPPAPERSAVFLDRDGTLIADAGYPRDPVGVWLLPGAAEALAALAGHGFLLVVVSNQSGVGRGLVSADQAAAVHARFVECLRGRGVRLDGCYYCPHAPEDGCRCRKPATGLLERAAAEWGIDLERSWLVGDKASDVEAGRRAGCDTVLLAGTMAVSDVRADCTAANWEEAVGWILRRSAESRCREPSGT
jgi:D-glycero-D-manno-heptose 1,7-bisphosphate phosphatase